MRTRPPTLSRTSLGYNYVRCQRGPHDDTVYIHQLCAIADGADPYDVFSDEFDVHHKPLDQWLDLDVRVPPTPIDVGDTIVPALDVPRGVEPYPRWEHRSGNLDTASQDVAADGGESA